MQDGSKKKTARAPGSNELLPLSGRRIKGGGLKPLLLALVLPLAGWQLCGCAPKIYKPPPLGAEHKFDEGVLRPEKKPRQLFDKKMNKYLQERGMMQKRVPARGADSSWRAPAPATTPASPANPVSSDSSRTAPR
ncbi:hypothetical protein [Compostibacter hankyongensis]|uniref:Uncharacterized protein n=1 Tax=Compostibacter hankyongensis TaxID=1007089 RepID=A0ABP8FE81_9BACT